MWELRWILLGLGVMFIGGLYLWSRNPVKFSFRLKPKEKVRTEPSIADVDALATDTEQPPIEDADEPSYAGDQTKADKIITLRFMGRGEAELDSQTVVLALRNAGLKHGKYGIFHSMPDDGSSLPRFSVASLTEPGSFDLTDLEGKAIAGMSFFMILPGPDDPVLSFDEMIQTARALSTELDGELFDERGSSWSIQRERYIREEIIAYRHQHSRV
ncbi:MAG: cell division protein ZipA C-terminal FtsZ-binding domain-containing protein [Gammaproteobacteria bacterium]